MQPTAERPALVRVDLDPDAQVMEALQIADMDIAYVGKPGEGIHIVADQQDIDLLNVAGVPFTVLHWDLTGFYENRLQSEGIDGRLSRDLGYGSMGGFFTNSEVGDKLDEFRSNHPDLITAKTSIGQSHQGRDVWAVKISDNPDLDEDEPEAIIDCLTHAREPQGMMSTLYFMHWVLENYPADPLARFLVDEREMWFVPVHNPDGYRYNQQIAPNGGGMWRKNRRNNGGGKYGVDLNRNWGYMWGYDDKGSSPNPGGNLYRGPYAMSEPEVQALANLIIDRNAVERMSIHCYGNMWLLPWCYKEILTPDDNLIRNLAMEMSPSNYAVGTSWEILYVVNGGSLDWDYGDQGIVSFSPEMGDGSDGFWPPKSRIVPIAEENLPSLQYYFAVAGAFYRLDDFELIDTAGKVNGYPDAGDTIDLVVTIMNRGLEDHPDPITMTIASSSPDVNIVNASSVIPPLASRARADNAAQPFVLEILPSAAYAGSVEMDLTITMHGIDMEEQIQFYVGTARRTIFDDLEYGLTQWQAGTPKDTANDGFWEWADPNGTWLSSEPVQPEDDNTPNGTHCLVTDNGEPGAGPNEHDVDGGFTMLVSPTFAIPAEAVHTKIGVSRWWYKSEKSERADNLVLTISNNNGAGWEIVEKERRRELNYWDEITFYVEDYVTPTDKMKIRFNAIDSNKNSTIEAAVDDFWMEYHSDYPALSLLGGLKLNETCTLGLSWEADEAYFIYVSTGMGSGVNLPGGIWYLDPPFELLLFLGNLPQEARVSHHIPLPDATGMAGTPFYFQAFTVSQQDGSIMISNCIETVVE
ncbi:MAG: M14 family metallopeptidase [Planctomycetota bacterium]